MLRKLVVLFDSTRNSTKDHANVIRLAGLTATGGNGVGVIGGMFGYSRDFHEWYDSEPGKFFCRHAVNWIGVLV